MKALILAGGFGTRMKKIVFDRPKSMVPIAGIPFLEHQIRFLKEQGIIDIIICVSYMADKIKSYFGDGKRIGVNITYSEEEVPLGTGGAIKKAEKYLDKTFLVLSGDTYFQIDLAKLLEFHKNKESKITISLTKTKNALHYGGVKFYGDKVLEFLEPGSSNEFVNAGVYVLESELLSNIPSKVNISLEKTVLPELAKQGMTYGFFYDGYFIDIGRPETYDQFKQDVLNSLILKENNTVREALRKIEKSGIPLILVTNNKNKFIGSLTDKDIQRSLVASSTNLDGEIAKIMNPNTITSSLLSTPEQKTQIFNLGASYLPILDEEGIIKDLEFRSEEVLSKSFPILRGKAPLRISFAGGGTDLPYFFDKYGGAVISATIDKYCYATIVKRADKKIIIDSDITSDIDITVESIDALKYDGHFDHYIYQLILP